MQICSLYSVCSHATPLHCSTGQGRIASPLFCAALQNRLTACYTYADLLLTQVHPMGACILLLPLLCSLQSKL
ncbi:TPA: hypothetical protein ACH3X1_015280 [Trebouxia sp. C0004]